MMESSAGGIADVHSGSFSDVLLIGDVFEVFCGVFNICAGQGTGATANSSVDSIILIIIA
jgi:hypothetical protein